MRQSHELDALCQLDGEPLSIHTEQDRRTCARRLEYRAAIRREDRCPACGHDGTDGHDQRTAPASCYSCGCGHPAADADRMYPDDLAAAVGSVDVQAAFELGYLYLEDLEHLERPDLILALRSRYSACPDHDERDDDCAACLELPDLYRPDLEPLESLRPGELDSMRWAGMLRAANLDRARLVKARGIDSLPPVTIAAAELVEIVTVWGSWRASSLWERAIVGAEDRTGTGLAVYAGWRAWPGDMAADYDASAERFELSPSGRWSLGPVPGAIPPIYAAGLAARPPLED